MVRSRRLRRVVRAVVDETREHRVLLLAAGLAYYLFLMLLPLSLLGLVVLEEFDRLGVAVRFVSSFAETSVTAGYLHSITGGEKARLRAGVIAAVLFVWSAFRTFRSINGLFADVYGTGGEETVPNEVLEVVIVLAVIVVVIPLAGLGGAAAAAVLGQTAWLASVPLFLFAWFLLAFYPLYYVFPSGGVGPFEALPGAVLTAVTWTVSGLGFRLYAELSRSVDLYGVVGAVLLLLTWLYVGGLALLVGIVLNATLAEPERTK